MKTWKRLFGCLLAGTMLLSLAACGGNDSPADDQAAAQLQEETAPPADTAGNTAAPEASAGENTADSGSVLVVYYSASGHTKTVAGYIAQATGGDIFEITPVEPYTDDDLNWSDSDSRVTREHEDESLRDVELRLPHLVGHRGLAGGRLCGGQRLHRQDGDPLLYLFFLRPGAERGAAGRTGRYRRLAGRGEVPLQRQPGGCKRVGRQPGAVRGVRKRQGTGATGSGSLLLMT